MKPAPRRYSWDEYLELEEASEEKNEYFDGHILAMAGGSPEHAVLVLAAGSELRAALKGRKCTAHGFEQRVRVTATGLGTYPDASVFCGEWETVPGDPNTLTNPLVLVEVLSPSTETYDRTEKFVQYKQIPSLREYVLVNTRTARLECYSRGDDDKWTLAEAGPGENLDIPALGIQLGTDAVYANVELPKPKVVAPKKGTGRSRAR